MFDLDLLFQEESTSEQSVTSTVDSNDKTKHEDHGKLRRSLVAARFASMGDRDESDVHKYNQNSDHEEEEDHLFVRKSTRELIIPVASMGDMVA